MKYYLIALLLTFLAFNVNASTIQVGPTRAVKDLSKMADGNEYVLDYGTYSFNQKFVVKKSLIIRSANPNARATLALPSMWGNTIGGPDVGIANGASFTCYGSCTMKDMKTSGGENVIVFQTNPGGSLLAQHVDMDGGGIWRGSGGSSVQILQVQSAGKPRAYFAANFNSIVDKVLIDLTGNTMPVQQGGHCTDGKPTCDSSKAQGETTLRVMDVNDLQVIGVITKPWLFDGQHEWKQDIQARPDSKMEQYINCHFYQPDVGDIASRAVPAHPIQEVHFKNCILDNWPHVTPGISKIVYENTTINGSIVNSTKNYSFTCPKTGTVKDCKIH